MNTLNTEQQRPVVIATLRQMVLGIGSLVLALALQTRIAGAQGLQLSCQKTSATALWFAQGPPGSEFAVQASTDLTSWMPVFADRFGTGPCQFIDPTRSGSAKRYYRAVLGPPGLDLASPPITNAAPYSQLVLSLAGVNLSEGGICARFFDAHGFTAEVPAVEVSSSGATFPVPPHLTAEPPAAGGSSLNLQVIQRTAGGEKISRTIRGFSIEDLPLADHLPGAVAIQFLEGTLNFAQTLLGELPGTPFDTVEIRQTLAGYTARTTEFIQTLRAAQGSPASSVVLGGVAGQPLVLDSRVLQNLDRLVLGFLDAQGGEVSLDLASVERLRTGSCAGAEAQAFGNALVHDPDSADVAGSAYYGAFGGCTADAFAKAYKIIGGAGGVALSLALLAGAPAEAVALASGTLLYVMIEGAGGLMALSGALGQESPAAAQMLQTGVAMTEDLLRGPAKSFLDGMTGAVLDLATSAVSLKEAFAAVALNPAPSTGIRPETMQLGSVGGCAGGTLTGNIEVFAPAGVAWTVEATDPLEDPTVDISSTSGSGPGTISFRIVGAPQVPTPGFSCEYIGTFQFSQVFNFTFSNGAFVSAVVEYEYLLVL